MPRWKVNMKCANPNCDSEGLYLRSGSLHTLDFEIADSTESGSEAIGRKIVWLCGKCTNHFEVQPWRPPGQQLQPRNGVSAQTLRNSTPRIRLAAQRLAS